MSTLDALLAGIVADPLEETRWLVLADWLQENDDPHRAELLRLHRRLLATCCEPDAHPERADWQARVVALLRAGVSPCGPQHTLPLPGGVPLVAAFVPPGSFRMGSDSGHSDETPAHRVTLTKGFFMGIHPVTQAPWKAVMGTDPSHFKGPDRPVESVSWTEYQEFCTKLTALLNGRATVRLPTEAEWEYACRAGTTTEYWSGNDEAALKRVGWYGGTDGPSKGETQPVGNLEKNPWGLHDVHGNVWEWCLDAKRWYTTKGEVDPHGISSDNFRVLRGGCWGNNPDYCRAALRFSIAPSTRGDSLGFRVALCLD